MPQGYLSNEHLECLIGMVNCTSNVLEKPNRGVNWCNFSVNPHWYCINTYSLYIHACLNAIIRWTELILQQCLAYICVHSVSSSCSIQFDDSGDHLSQMVNVFATFLNINCIPEMFDPYYKLGFVSWFDLTSNEFVPKVFFWFMSGEFKWGFPPVDIFLWKEVSCFLWGVFKVIVLH